VQAIINKTLTGSALVALLSPFVVLAGDEAGPLEQARTAAPRSHGPMILHERHGKMTTSTNWSGYAVTDPTGSVTDVSGSWIVPAIVGSCEGRDDGKGQTIGPATKRVDDFYRYVEERRPVNTFDQEA
jgi:hypothetical protein